MLWTPKEDETKCVILKSIWLAKFKLFKGRRAEWWATAECYMPLTNVWSQHVCVFYVLDQICMLVGVLPARGSGLFPSQSMSCLCETVSVVICWAFYQRTMLCEAIPPHSLHLPAWLQRPLNTQPLVPGTPTSFILILKKCKKRCLFFVLFFESKKNECRFFSCWFIVLILYSDFFCNVCFLRKEIKCILILKKKKLTLSNLFCLLVGPAIPPFFSPVPLSLFSLSPSPTSFIVNVGIHVHLFPKALCSTISNSQAETFSTSELYTIEAQHISSSLCICHSFVFLMP